MIQTFSHHPSTSDTNNKNNTNDSSFAARSNQDWHQFTASQLEQQRQVLVQQYQQEIKQQQAEESSMGGKTSSSSSTSTNPAALTPDAVFDSSSYLLPGAHKDLFQPDLHMASAPQDWTGYETATKLWEELAAWIGVTGKPMSVADYMRLCLSHPQYGYYTRGTSAAVDPFDQDDVDDLEENDDSTTKPSAATSKTSQFDPASIIGGDFITAPELSQMFGESLGIWMTLTAQQQERPFAHTSSSKSGPKSWKQGWQYVEAGPGKGSLLVDLIRCWKSLQTGKEVGSTVVPQAIHLLETSPELRRVQQERLRQEMNDANHKDNHKGGPTWKLEFHQAKLLHTSKQPQTNSANEPESLGLVQGHPALETPSVLSSSSTTATSVTTQLVQDDDDKNNNNNSQPDGDHDETVKTIPVYWHDNFLSFQVWQHQHQSYLPTFAICQEFLDALPIYAFEKTREGWRERLVDIALRQDLEDEQRQEQLEQEQQHNDQVHNKEQPGAASASSSASSSTDTNTKEASASSSSSSSKSDLLKEKLRLRIVLSPEATPATKTLLRLTPEGLLPSEVESGLEAPIGSVVEVNPEAVLLVQELAQVIGRQGGGALIVDYGQEGSRDSIRAFGQHEQVHFLSKPGQVDVTADVDFAALKHAVNTSHVRHQEQQAAEAASAAAESATSNGTESPATPDAESSETSTTTAAVGEARAYGPVAQGIFLMSMGIKERAIQLSEAIEKQARSKHKLSSSLQEQQEIEHDAAEQIDTIYNAMVRLCSADEMGERFKVLAIVPKPPAKDDNAFFESKPPGF